MEWAKSEWDRGSSVLSTHIDDPYAPLPRSLKGASIHNVRLFYNEEHENLWTRNLHIYFFTCEMKLRRGPK